MSYKHPGLSQSPQKIAVTNANITKTPNPLVGNIDNQDLMSDQVNAIFRSKLQSSWVPVVEYYCRAGDDLLGKAARLQSLGEALQILTQQPVIALQADQDYEAVVTCFAKSCLRTLPPPQNPQGEEYDPEEDEPVQNPAWPALSIVYDLMIRTLDYQSANINCLKRFITMNFCHKLISLLDSEDPREREAVKTCLHRIYGKLLQLRAPLRRAIHGVFLESIHCSEKHKLAELLEIFGSIINGFAVPLRDEHKSFLLQRCLLPLHTVRHLSTFYPQLAYCIMQFVEKESTLGTMIITYLLQHWPKTNSLKEVMLLGELEEILDISSPDTFSNVREALFKRLAECIRSSHFQVAERALILWTQNEYVMSLLSDPDNFSRILPIVYGALCEGGKQHWNKNVQAMSLAALSALAQMDPVMYEEYRKDRSEQGFRVDLNIPMQLDVFERRTPPPM